MSGNIDGQNTTDISKILGQYKEMHKASGADVENIKENDLKSIFEQDLSDGKIDGKYEKEGKSENILNGFNPEIVSQEYLDKFNAEIAQFMQSANNDAARTIESIDLSSLQGLGYDVQQNLMFNPTDGNRLELSQLQTQFGYYGEKADGPTQEYMNDLNNKVAENKTPLESMREELNQLQVQYGYYGENADEATKTRMNDLNTEIAQALETEDAKHAQINPNTITQDDDISVISAKMQAQKQKGYNV